MKRSSLLLLACAAALVFLSGCALLLPRTTALKSVHQTYRDEFAQQVVPLPEQQSTPPPESPPFGKTLQAIRNFRVQFGGDSAEGAHLTVLEGMIYLQSGRIGMAKLLAPEVRDRIPQLKSGTDRDVRDALFAENFGDLVQGWEEIHDKFDSDRASFTEWQKLQSAADNISTNLQQKLEAKRLAAPESDQGAIYLATTAGIFYDWAYANQKIPEPDQAETNRRAWFAVSHDLIGRFLSETEKKAANDTNALTTTSPARIRYVNWYGWLGRHAN